MWNNTSNYNKFKNSYFQGYIDISGGGVILRKGNDLFFETNSYTLSGLITTENTYINLYTVANTAKNSSYTALLTISSYLKLYINSLNDTNTTKTTLYNKQYATTLSSYIISIPTHAYSPAYDASGNFNNLNITISGYSSATKYTSISGKYFTLSGLTFGTNILSTLQSSYATALSNYNSALSTNNTNYLNMMTLSNTIFINRNNNVYQTLPIYTSLNTTLINSQNQLNTLSSVIVATNNNLQSQINTLGGNTYQKQINTISSVIVLVNNNLQSQINTLGGTTLTNYQTQINTISSVIVITKNNLQSQISALGGNTYQTQINTISSVIVITKNNLQSQISALGGNSYQTQINTISSVIVETKNNLQTQINTVANNTTFPSLTVNGTTAINGNTTINGNLSLYVSNLIPISLFRYVPWAEIYSGYEGGAHIISVDWVTGVDTYTNPLFNNSPTFSYKYSIIGNTVYLQYYYRHTVQASFIVNNKKYFFVLPDQSIYIPQNIATLTPTSYYYNKQSGNVLGSGSFFIDGLNQGIFQVYMAQTATQKAIALFPPSIYITFGTDCYGFAHGRETIYSFECSYEIQV